MHTLYKRCSSLIPMHAILALTMASALVSAQSPPVLDTSHLKAVSFWATSYWVYSADNAAAGIPLRDPSDKLLGPVLSKKDWCSAALEGTVRVGGETYNFAKVVKGDHIDCSEYFKPDIGYSRFTLARGSFGDGTDGYVLVPYRTIAANPSFLKAGTVMYIPSALGQQLPDGTKHDGYFFIADTGGEIKGNHIDVFQGDRVVPFPFIQSRRTPIFIGYIVRDPEILSRLQLLHTLPPK